MDKKLLQLTAIEQRKIFEKQDALVQREIDHLAISTNKVTAISGIRRSGKSTLLKQIAKDLEGYYYLNFEDERLIDFTYSDFNMLYEVFLENFNEQNTFLFDEIQNIYGWEKFVRRLFDEGRKVFVTGSNAKLLSSELATSLTGRHLKLELFPFSFKEFLFYKGVEIKKFYDTKEKSSVVNHFREYVKLGGFPEIVISRDMNELKQLYQDVLLKDLIVRFKIRDTKAFRELALFLISNASSPASFNNLKKLLGFKSVTTVKNYVDFLEESYLIFSVSKFDYSIKKQIINDRKIYAIDTGIINSIAFLFSENFGHLLENIAYIELKRRGQNIYYHQNKKECDFLIKQGSRITQAIQVTETLVQKNQDREIAGLIEAMEWYRLSRGIIITFDQEKEFKIKNRMIKTVPIWKWLLGLEHS